MFAKAYMGRKRIFSNAFTPRASILALGRSLHTRVAKTFEGAAPWAAPRLFQPMYAGANMGHPSREEGLVLRSDRSAADGLHLPQQHTDNRSRHQVRHSPRKHSPQSQPRQIVAPIRRQRADPANLHPDRT
jgi:hypothetical protein